MVFTSSLQMISSSLRVMINDKIHLVRIVEDTILVVNHCGCNRGSYRSDKDRVSSEGSEM